MKQFKLLVLSLMFVLVLGMIPTHVFAQTSPSTVLETGDHFEYSESQHNENSDTRYFSMRNASDLSQLFRYEEDGWSEVLMGSGTTDVSMIRSGGNHILPNDTALLVENDIIAQAGSQRTGYSYFYEMDDPQWYNNTHPVEDLSGMHMGDGGGQDDFMGVMSNSTYAVIFPEMQMNQMSLDFGLPLPSEWGFSFDGVVPRIGQWVNAGSINLTINGATQNLTTTNVTTHFMRDYTETNNVSLKLGDENDDNAPVIEVEMTLSIRIDFMQTIIYDQETTLPLQVIHDNAFEFSTSFYNPNVTLDFDPTNTGEEWYTEIDSYSSHVSSSHSNATMNYASAFYGNIRPESSGSNRVEEGDSLHYLMDMENRGNFQVDFSADNGSLSFGNHEDMRAESRSDGDAFFDIYRHQPGSFESTIFFTGESFGEWEENRWDTFNSQTTDEYHSGVQSYGPEPAMFLDLFFATSTADREIGPFFEDSMWIEDDMFRCDGPDCEGEFWPDYPREMGQTYLNETDFYINLITDADAEPFDINGFTQYEFNVSAAIQYYSLLYTGIIEIPIGDMDRNPAWVNATITIEAEGQQEFYYDSETGALIVFSQGYDAHIDISFSGDVYMSDLGSNMPVEISASIESKSHMFMQLNEHPYLYNTQPTSPTDDVLPGSSSSTTPPANDSSSAGIQLPLPVAPFVVTGLGIALLVRRKEN